MMTETLHPAHKDDDGQGLWERCVQSGQKRLAFSRRDTGLCLFEADGELDGDSLSLSYGPFCQ